mmetsp:Transcript_16028/g.24963  ORF Transcript_16028/g.24963 Transcript_16028/m.24963 type:complete len:210 (+) Transcript_16028:919-1548(+)
MSGSKARSVLSGVLSGGGEGDGRRLNSIVVDVDNVFVGEVSVEFGDKEVSTTVYHPVESGMHLIMGLLRNDNNRCLEEGDHSVVVVVVVSHSRFKQPKSQQVDDLLRQQESVCVGSIGWGTPSVEHRVTLDETKSPIRHRVDVIFSKVHPRVESDVPHCLVGGEGRDRLGGDVWEKIPPTWFEGVGIPMLILILIHKEEQGIVRVRGGV